MIGQEVLTNWQASTKWLTSKYLKIDQQVLKDRPASTKCWNAPWIILKFDSKFLKCAIKFHWKIIKSKLYLMHLELKGIDANTDPTYDKYLA